jgi:hypothetical protein
MVQPIARGCLCNLHTLNYGKAVQHQSKMWGGFQRFL